MSKMVKMVDVNVNRFRMSYKIDFDFLGVKLTKEQKSFAEEYIDAGSINILPRKILKEINSLDSAIRTRFKTNAVTVPFGNGSIMFMTEEMYNEYLPYFEIYKKEYYEKLEEILKEYDNSINIFFDLLTKYLENNKNKREIMRKIKDTIPRKEDYSDKFSVKLSQFELDIEGREEIKYFTGDCLRILYELCKKVEKSMEKNGKIAGRTLLAITDTLKKVSRINIKNNEAIINICSDLLEVRKLGGYGQNSARLVRKCKGSISCLVHELGVQDLINW